MRAVKSKVIEESTFYFLNDLVLLGWQTFLAINSIEN